MDWRNIDLKDGWEADLNLIENLKFSTLLMEINCNLPYINEQTVRKQFETDLRSRIDDAREIFEANLANIVKHAQERRNEE
jgi:hypothetical protein